MIQGTLCSSSRGRVLKQGGQEHRLHESGGEEKGLSLIFFCLLGKIGLEESIRLRVCVCVCRCLCVCDFDGLLCAAKKKKERSAMKSHHAVMEKVN